jgi:LysM repeat protein
MGTNRVSLVWLAAVFLLTAGWAAPPRQDVTPTASETATVEVIATATETLAATAAATEDATSFPQFPPVWLSPTPDANGAIIVIVQPGESLWVIAARAGLTLPELLALNNLPESAIINPGDALVVGYVTPVAPSPEAGSPTAPPPPPTNRPTATPATATICLSAFDDLNRDGVFDPDEPLRAGVAFTIYNTTAVVANYITDGRSEPKCLDGLAPGEYRVARSIAPGETLTTAGDWSLSLAGGGELRQAFGSFIDANAPTAISQSIATPSPATATPPSSPAPPLPRSPANSLIPRLAGVAALFFGGLLLLGAVLILLFRQTRSQSAPSSPPETTGGERRFRDLDDLE